MNCFNIKELQSIVRRKFFFELMDENVYNTQLSNTLIGLKKNITTENSITKYNQYNMNSIFTKDIVIIISGGRKYIEETFSSISTFLILYGDIVLRYIIYICYMTYMSSNYIFLILHTYHNLFTLIYLK